MFKYIDGPSIENRNVKPNSSPAHLEWALTGAEALVLPRDTTRHFCFCRPARGSRRIEERTISLLTHRKFIPNLPIRILSALGLDGQHRILLAGLSLCLLRR
jgi:hypothetical protein